LDASVLIAIMKNERLDDSALYIVQGAVISTVNLAEVWTKLHELGLTNDPRIDALIALLSRIEPFSASQARMAADLRPVTRHAGLSLGDRACLALTIELGADVYTTEHVWSKLDVGCRIHCLR
jgi:ribonuclease VapC